MSSTAKTKPSSKDKKWSDLGETWLSCSGIHPEAWTQVKPKPDKSTLRVNQRSLFFVILKADPCLFIKKIAPFYKKKMHMAYL